MPKKSVRTQEDAERQKHILDLQSRANEFTGDDLSFFESEQMSTKLQEQCIGWAKHRAAHLFAPYTETRVK